MARIFRKLAQLLDVDLTSTAPADGDALTYDAGSETWVPGAGGGGGGAPTDATYITQTANGDLDNEQALSALATGLVKVTNGTGVLSTATGGTDYANASHQHAGEDITSGVVADARIASTIARDSEVTSAISALSSVYQAKDTTLDTYAGIDPSANVQSVLSAADYAAIRTLLGLVIGTNVQAYDADLTTYAGITPSANVQALLGAADYAAMRTLLDVPTNAAAILDALIDAKGDLLVGTADNTVARLAAGTDGHVLTLDSGQTAGMKWAAAAGGSGGMTLISDTLVAGSAAASFDITSIAGTYKHLRLMVMGRSTTSANNAKLVIRFNNDSGNNYDWERRYSSGSDTGNGQSWIQACEVPAANVGSQYAGSVAVDIYDYAGTTFNKMVDCLGGRAASTDSSQMNVTMTHGGWRSTAAITRITVFPDNGSWAIGSRCTLWGLS